MQTSKQPAVHFRAYHPGGGFAAITGSTPASLVLQKSQNNEQLYHEACIYHASSRSVLITSNQLPLDGHEATANKTVKLLRVYDGNEAVNSRVEEVIFPGIDGAMLNGGVNGQGEDSVLLCAQGSRNHEDLSGIIELELPSSTDGNTMTSGATCSATAPKVVVSDFHGIRFNSVNDVIVHPVDGSIWFTDPSYGFHQGIRPQPELPNQVYRYDVKQGTIRAVASDFVRPNGLCFSPDLTTLYVTDTGCIHGSSEIPLDRAGPSHIYAFDIMTTIRDNGGKDQTQIPFGPFLSNRCLFAFAPGRCPDGIKCDTQGNVYSGCGDGIEVWNRHGEALGTFEIDGGVANFCFGEPGVIYACNETRLIKITIEPSVEGALLAARK